ncbi:Subtilisin-like protease SBT4.14 [Cucurbita argyrosperma subsp. argyrosperma]|nr:Subtilisin-like protease SBT4.14 [Cucurbita argyrosperma subsp. argyrosperma]
MSLKESHVEAKEAMVYSYTKSFNAFAAKLTEQEANALSKRGDVTHVIPNRRREIQTTRSWDFIGFSSNAKRRPNRESNIIVGLFDTGISPTADSFKDDGFGPPPKKWKGTCQKSANFSGCNNKLIGARYFMLEGSAGPQDIMAPVDVTGHGTHTSSTAAGNVIAGASLSGLAEGTARGGVPSARVAMYKVCWVGVGCSDMDILAAFDAAIHDGVDVISISIAGTGFSNYSEDVMAIGAFQAMQKGIITVAAAGNTGPAAGSVVNTAPWIVTVAASTIDREFVTKLVLGNGWNISGVGINLFNEQPKMYPLVDGGDVAKNPGDKTSANFCMEGSLDPTKANGKLVFCQLMIWGADSAVKTAGAHGAVIQSDQYYLDHTDLFMVPATLVNSTIGQTIEAYIKSTKTPTAMIYRTVQRQAAAPFVASFSARGPNQRSRLILKSPDGEFGYGAGLLNPDRAREPGLIYEADKMSYIQHLCNQGYNASSISILTGAGPVDCSTLIPAQGYDSLNYPTFQLSLNNTRHPTTAVFWRQVTNVGRPTSVYKATITAPPGVEITVEPTSLSFSSLQQTQSFKVVVKANPLPPQNMVSGSLTWAYANYVVRSPIVIYTHEDFGDNEVCLFLSIFLATSTAAVDQQSYIIHMDTTKMAAPTPEQWYTALIDSINEISSLEDQEEASNAAQILYVYKTAISGFAAKLSTKKLHSLSKTPGFLAATPNELLQLHTTHSPHVKIKNPKGIGISVKPEKLSFRRYGQKLSYQVSFVALGKREGVSGFSFGSLVWVSGTYAVRSPIAVTWNCCCCGSTILHNSHGRHKDGHNQPSTMVHIHH